MGKMLDDPTFWVLVAFAIFVAALGRRIAGFAAVALDRRADKIGADLEEAERLRTEAQDLLAAARRKQREAVKEAEAIVARAKEEAERLTQQGKARLEAQLERRRQLALDRIRQAEAEALAEVRAAAVDVAIDAARRLLAERITERKADALVASAIAKLPERLR
jgi:F-type H+-transporting ATPase subunit b